MRKTLFWAALAAAVVLAASCASTPPKAPEPEPEPKAVQAVPAPEAELAKAKELKDRADAYDLGQYAPEEYAAAEKDLAAGEAAYGKDNAAAKKSLDKAVEGYTAVIAKGGAILVDRIQRESESSKKAADAVKAAVAVKEEYAAALALYNAGLAAKSREPREGRFGLRSGPRRLRWRRGDGARQAGEGSPGHAGDRGRAGNLGTERGRRAEGPRQRGHPRPGRRELRRDTMKTTTRISFLVALVLCAAAAALPAQSLLDNDYYFAAKDLQAQSQEALEAGEYDEAARLAAEARDYLARSDAFVADRARFYRAKGWLAVGNERLAYAKDVGAEENFKDDYIKASSDLRGAKLAMDIEEYETSVILSKSAIDALKDVQYVSKPEPAAEGGRTFLAEVLRGAAHHEPADCFWRIAEYPFVYGDPRKWKLLYEANKGLLSDPANPDLIERGAGVRDPEPRGREARGHLGPGKEVPPAAIVGLSREMQGGPWRHGPLFFRSPALCAVLARRAARRAISASSAAAKLPRAM